MIETANVETHNDATDDAAAGHFVVLSVSDNGCGIPAANLPKVFEPFFTTKPPGKGSALGLSMVYGFAAQSGGHVRIESKVGVGTSVRLYLRPSQSQ